MAARGALPLVTGIVGYGKQHVSVAGVGRAAVAGQVEAAQIAPDSLGVQPIAWRCNRHCGKNAC